MQFFCIYSTTEFLSSPLMNKFSYTSQIQSFSVVIPNARKIRFQPCFCNRLTISLLFKISLRMCYWPTVKLSIGSYNMLRFNWSCLYILYWILRTKYRKLIGYWYNSLEHIHQIKYMLGWNTAHSGLAWV